MDNNDLKVSLALKDNFSNRRHQEKVQLLELRTKLTIKIIELRDTMAIKRHKERIKILTETY